MDLSDGLAATARAMAEASGVGVVLEADAIPVAEAARAWAASARLDPVSFALAGGEDYELAFAVPPAGGASSWPRPAVRVTSRSRASAGSSPNAAPGSPATGRLDAPHRRVSALGTEPGFHKTGLKRGQSAASAEAALKRLCPLLALFLWKQGCLSPPYNGTMLLSRSLRRKLLATLIGAVALMLRLPGDRHRLPVGAGGRLRASGGGARLPFVATAYCKGTTTASGVAVRSGIAAADPRLLPVGSVVRLDGTPEGHEGIYTVLDTGPKVQGRHVDLYMWSCHEALAFGRRKVSLTVLRRGWHPNGAAAAAAKGD